MVGKQHPRRANGLRMRSLALSETPCTWRRPLYGTWETSPASGQNAGPAHEGNSRTMGMYADEESDGCLVPKKPRTMPSNVGGGDGGGKAAGQGEGTLQCMPRTQRRICMLLKQRAYGSELHGYPIPRRPITFDLRQEPGAGKPHAGSARGRGAILVPTVTVAHVGPLRCSNCSTLRRMAS